MSIEKIIALVPAAGRSRRMGRPKPLVLIDGTPMLLATLAPLLAVADLRVIAVVSGNFDEQLDLPARGVIVARNDDPKAEMIDSIRIGVRTALTTEDDPAGWLIMPGDQPGVPVEEIERCAARFREDPARIVIASHEGRRGHPMIFPQELIGDVLGPLCDEGLNRLVQRHADRVVVIACASTAVVRNVNTPDDLREVR